MIISPTPVGHNHLSSYSLFPFLDEDVSVLINCCSHAVHKDQCMVRQITILRHTVTYSMQQSPSWESNRSSGSQVPPHYMEPECSLLHSQVPATCPYPESHQSSPYPHIPPPEDPSIYYPPIYTWVFQVVKCFTHCVKYKLRHCELWHSVIRYVADVSAETDASIFQSVRHFLTEGKLSHSRTLGCTYIDEGVIYIPLP
jgi:hypothetical protein